MLMFHKLGGLYPGRFLKPNPVEYTVCVNRMALSCVYAWLPWLQTSEETVGLNSLCNYTTSNLYSGV